MKFVHVSPLLLTLLMSCGQESSRNEVEDIAGGATPETETPYASTQAQTVGTSLLDHTKFANSVDVDTKKYIQYDLKNLANWTDTGHADALSKFGAVAGLKEVNATTVGQWFMDRMTYIFPDDGEDFKFSVVVPADKSIYDVSSPRDASALIAGSNVGSEIYDFYLYNKANGAEGVMMIFNGQRIPFLSPRTGAMQIGPALFGSDDSLDESRSASHRIVKSIYRLGILIHEARHSDGNEAAGTFGFSHVNCPANGSVAAEYVGLPACDGYANGAYNVGAQLLSALASLCDGVCNNQDTSALQAVRIDLLSRLTVADEPANYGDATPEAPLAVINTTGFDIVPE